MKLLVSRKRWLGWRVGEPLEVWLRERWIFSEDEIRAWLRDDRTTVYAEHSHETVPWLLIDRLIIKIEEPLFEALRDQRQLNAYLDKNPAGRFTAAAMLRLEEIRARERQAARAGSISHWGKR